MIDSRSVLDINTYRRHLFDVSAITSRECAVPEKTPGRTTGT
ncbi:hypothetical protein I546_6116 [Mycobacterium kansasii 732]|nr:hypothetical protein I546_6116 [Mycobacterium kansasii 732]